MTLEEEQEFRQKVIETILPHAINMTEDQIRNIIQTVEKNCAAQYNCCIIVFYIFYGNKRNLPVKYKNYCSN